MGRSRRQGNCIPQKKKKHSIEDLVGNEENAYSVPNPSKTMINVTNELSETHKKNSQKGNHEQDH
jgi:hypothetical protein